MQKLYYHIGIYIYTLSFPAVHFLVKLEGVLLQHQSFYSDKYLGQSVLLGSSVTTRDQTTNIKHFWYFVNICVKQDKVFLAFWWCMLWVCTKKERELGRWIKSSLACLPIAFYEERGKELATRKYDVVFLPVNHLFKLNTIWTWGLVGTWPWAWLDELKMYRNNYISPSRHNCI